MKPSIVKAGICTAVTAAVTVTLSGLLPVSAHAAPSALDMSKKLAGKTVFLDPGHQGSNHTQDLARQVSDGRGGTKDCQTTGMTTMNGVPEHTITWNVAQVVKTSLETLGAHVVLSRQDDMNWGGCVDDRARAASQSGADVAVSIHADSAPAQYRGFHLIVPELPIPNPIIDQAQSGAGLAASKSVRDAYREAGFPPANYGGVVDGLQTRKDIAGPALTTVPVVFLEMGNGANPEDAALLETPDGQLKHAIALTTGVVGHLLGAQPGTSSDQQAAQSVPQGTSFDRPAVNPDAPQGQTNPAAPQAQTSPGTPQAQTNPVIPQAQTIPAVPQSPAAPAVPQAQVAPGTSTPKPAPGTATPQSPGTSAAPKSPGTSGNQSPGTPNAQQSPGTAGGDASIMELLMPLAKMLGLDDNAIATELINLGYSLAGMLLGPSK
ncbi:N-acetylmuramoyl-L-alanine amidase [Nocardia gipuzkoensis]|uniref:N-acetylmuramoyl-L-alanine amidase n=1 Tax=Nocardia gipuzkoensis TaxID=2749991 RepID=UPI001E63154E|nr:N-acetylmuramoyl-L-alanine amidase [Nocardia gipuzkoensis]UGT65993.1 N-acetylmuramoyl-L-alanine amidase [Nocardia gipuzkoensis]